MVQEPQKNKSSIKIDAARIVGYAIYDRDESVYPIVVDGMYQSANGHIDSGRDSDLDGDLSAVLQESQLCWQVLATRNRIVIHVGITDQYPDSDEWMDRAQKAFDADDKKQQYIRDLWHKRNTKE